MFAKMSTEAKLAMKKSFRDAKKSGKIRRLTKYEMDEFDARMKKKDPTWHVIKRI